MEIIYSVKSTANRKEFLMLTFSFSASWLKDDVFYQCRNLSVTNKITKENYRYLPVYTSNGRVYHNRFCAQCNGIESREITEYKLYFGCSVLPLRSLSENEQIEFLFSHCDSKQIRWAAPSEAPRRFCLDLKETDLLCQRDVDGKCSNGTTRIVSVERSFVNYKNKHCADLCHRSGKYVCGPGKFFKFSGFLPSAKPFSVIFNFGEKVAATVKITCPLNEPYYDPYLELCRAGFNPNLQLSRKSNHQEYEVLFWLQSEVQTNMRMRNALKVNISDSKTLERVLGIHHEQLSKMKLSDISQSLFTLKFNLKVNLTNEAKRVRRDTTNSPMYVDRILNFIAPFYISVLNINFTVFKVTTRILSCVNLQRYQRHEYTVLSNDRSAVEVIKTKEMLKSNGYYTLNGTSANDSPVIFVCRHHHTSNCSGQWVLMNEGEFTVLQNRSILVNASKHLFDSTKYMWQNRSLYVCENFSTTYLRKVMKEEHAVLVVLTYVCMVISIIALVFVLITYSLFTELRTPPGINLMNLSVSILLAQLLWILGSGQTDTPIACTVIAVLLHYFFLVSFVWTSIIAFDTWRAFTGKGRRSLADSKRNRLVHCLRYMAVGWLSVMVYVAICIAIDQSEITLIGYGSRDACWIADNNAKLYFFAIPVGLIIVFNIVFYSMTVKAIRDTRSQTSLVNDQSDKKRDFDVYVRIGSLMGFTWIFGFAASFGWLFLSYVFVVLNSLHGVYIAVAFALNERAIKLYVDLVRGKPSSIKEKQQVDRGRTHGSAPVHTAVVSKLEETTTIIVNKSPITPRVACNIISLKDEIKKKAWY